MRLFPRSLTMAIVAMSLLASPSVQSQEPESLDILIGGTGSALGGMTLLAVAYREVHPEIEITVLPSLGSSGGIRALLAGQIDLAVSARPLRDTEMGEGVTSNAYAITPLVVATSVGTPVDGLDLSELVSIYDGALTNWPDGTPIRLVLRPETESDMVQLRQFSPEMDRSVAAALARPGLFSAATDQENADALETLPGAIGVTSLGQIMTENRDLKALAIDGVTPTAELAAAGTDQFVKTLYLVTTDDASEAVREFVEFVGSPEGQAILVANGHAPAE